MFNHPDFDPDWENSKLDDLEVKLESSFVQAAEQGISTESVANVMAKARLKP